jgi:hypothetical protein
VSPGGIVLVVAGTWVILQVMGGKALQRLGWVAGPDPNGALPGTPGTNGDSGLGDGGQVGGGPGGGPGSSW